MSEKQRSMAVRQTIALATQALGRGDAAALERLVAPLTEAGDAAALNLLGAARIGQQRFAEAVSLLSRARAAEPSQPQVALNLGNALAGAGQLEDAIAAFRAALRLKPDFAAALFALAGVLHHTGQWEDAENAYRKGLRLAPDNSAGRLALSAALIDRSRFDEAESVLRQGLRQTHAARPAAHLHNNLAIALRHRGKSGEALLHLEKAGTLDPGLPLLDMLRAETLEDLRRYDEAAAAWRKLLAREPGDPRWHQAYNDLLYRLGRMEDYLKSYDRAPRSRDLQLGKAFFLTHEGRAEEACAIYRDMLARDPHDRDAAARIGLALSGTGRHREALAAFETALALDRSDAELFAGAARAAIQCGDPQKAVALCEEGLRIQPDNQICLANLGTALRLMEDERDEALNGYDSLIQVFDLEPPAGFSEMESFNAELLACLERLHPQTREYVNQSLRGGTQTAAHLFGGGHILVERLRARIDESLARYIAALKEDETHPFLSRRRNGFAYAGSWSSRLKDCGFHVNHLHPGGWISSCYYVGVPDAVRDEQGRQGWIKFGEPGFATALDNPVRRAIRPAPGRLVLFPSYMWHGTVPFHDRAPRTTIAFDAIPA